MRRNFDIEKAKAGAKIVTRDGRTVEILKYDYIQCGEQQLVACTTDDEGDNFVIFVHHNGSLINGNEHDLDLFIEEEPTYRPYTSAAELDNAIKEATMNNVNDCNSCRFLKLKDAGLGFAYPECKAQKKHHPIYGFSNSNCDEVRNGLDNCPKWQLGGLKGFIKRLFE